MSTTQQPPPSDMFFTSATRSNLLEDGPYLMRFPSRLRFVLPQLALTICERKHSLELRGNPLTTITRFSQLYWLWPADYRLYPSSTAAGEPSTIEYLNAIPLISCSVLSMSNDFEARGVFVRRRWERNANQVSREVSTYRSISFLGQLGQKGYLV